jgi:hypothetical protein
MFLTTEKYILGYTEDMILASYPNGNVQEMKRNEFQNFRAKRSKWLKSVYIMV